MEHWVGTMRAQLFVGHNDADSQGGADKLLYGVFDPYFFESDVVKWVSHTSDSTLANPRGE
eukprot:9038717-Prorocentrum_lima.AAC.1